MQGDNLGVWPERINRHLIRAGERFGIDCLLYNPIVFYRWHVYATVTRQAFADSMLAAFPDAHSFADVGAGTGTYAAGLRRLGKRVVACEKMLFGRALGWWQRIPTRSFDLTRSTPAKLPPADVAYCLEVAEHATPQEGDRLVQYLARFPTVLFTAAHPGQGGQGHINEQPREYWMERFEWAGMSFDAERSELISSLFRQHGAPWWLIDNALVFRATPSLAAAPARSRRSLPEAPTRRCS